MKKLSLVLITVFVFTFSSFSQKSLSIGLHGGFGGPMFNTTFFGSPSFSIGGGGAALISNHLFIGGYGMGTSSINPIFSDIPDYEDFKIESEYGGVWVGYIFRTKNVYFTVSGKSAWGDLQLINTTEHQIIYSDIAILTPSLEIERKFGFMSIAVGAYYNFFRNVDLLTYTNSSFSAPGVSLNLKFGLF